MTLSDDDKPDSPSDDEILPCKWTCGIMNKRVGCGKIFPRRDFADVSEKGIKPGDPMYFGICMDCFAGPVSQRLGQPAAAKARKPAKAKAKAKSLGAATAAKARKPAAATAGNSDSDGESSTPTLVAFAFVKKKAAVEKKPAVKKQTLFLNAKAKKKPDDKTGQKKIMTPLCPSVKKKLACLTTKPKMKPSVKKKPASMQASSSKNPSAMKKHFDSTSESELSPIKHRRTTKKPATTSRTSAAQSRITKKKPAASPESHKYYDLHHKLLRQHLLAKDK